MASKSDKLQQDLERLVGEGWKLLHALQKKHNQSLAQEHLKAIDNPGQYLETLPSFDNDYQLWYSESQAVIKQVLPGRLADFKKQYEAPSERSMLVNNTYVLEDYLNKATSMYVDLQKNPQSLISRFEQQLGILRAAQKRFKSSLFDIQRLLQADLFDSELHAATELNTKAFTRGAGAVAGVVLEGHLKQVCENHNINIDKKNPTISDYNNSLKTDGVIDVAKWRFVQHLADVRNKCDHKTNSEPTKEEVNDLIEGVDKIIKTVF